MTSRMNTRPDLAIGVTVAWILLQVPRLSAIPLVGDALAGRESIAWLYPAILDVASATAAPIVAYLLWRKRGPSVWALAITFLSVCVVDAVGAVIVGLNVPSPAIFGGPDDAFVVYPGLVALISLGTLVVLTTRRMRIHYLGVLR